MTNDVSMEELGQIFPLKFLWKYLSLAPDQTPRWQDRLRQLAVEGRAYYPSPRDFNDPFDCLPHITSPGTPDEIAAAVPALIARMVKTVTGAPPEQIEAQLRVAFAAKTPEMLAYDVRESVQKTSREMGVFCLSGIVDNVLMWSHYASNHSGIALRFDFKVQSQGGLMPLFKVQYDDRRPHLTNFFTEDGLGDISGALATKAKFWNYEEEWRSFVPGGAKAWATFDPAVVSGIAFGVNCTSENEAEVREIVGGRGMEFLRVIPTPDTFALSLIEA